MKDVLVAADLVGCRYRLVQRRRHPEAPPTEVAQARAQRHAAAEAVVLDALPRKAPGRFRRVDLSGDEWERSMATLEAIAAGYTHITGAVFSSDLWQVEVELLLREGEKYTPIIVSNHRAARRSPNKKALAVPTHRLGLSTPLEVPYRLRCRAADGYRLALAARALEELGKNSGRGGLIGQDRTQAFFLDTDSFDVAAALERPIPDKPRRVKECDNCRFWRYCGPQLEQMDDISLFLSGDRAAGLRARGIETVQALIDADLGTPSQLAAAWRAGVVLVKRSADISVPRAEVEVDVDMEAYLDQGAYLWGTWHEGSYRPFVTWDPLGGQAEAANFARFWDWLMDLRASAHAAGRSFAAYCYSANGENHWMRASAERFGYPSVRAVEEFISSPEWVDLFASVKKNFVGLRGLGLKVVAPVAGFRWAQEDFSGEESVDARRAALAGDLAAREQLLTYNAGDVQATAVVREWMDAGAPGVETLAAAPKRR